MSDNFHTVDLLTGDTFLVTWDVGRRCNYDCSYCPSHRHDNFSPHATLEQLKSTTDFLFQYVETIMPYRKWKWCNVSFTGGEPTVNPNFLKFAEYLQNKYETEYKDKFNLNLSLTSNGAMSKKIADGIMKYFTHATISYHCEADKQLKKQAVDIIEYFSSNKKFKLKVNVMFHADPVLFQECLDLCDYFDSKNIKYVPRVIGEEPGSKPNFAHKYTDEQLQWFKDYWKKDTEKTNNTPILKDQSNSIQCASAAIKEIPIVDENKKIGMSIGRPCCGGRTMNLCSSDSSWNKSKFVSFREFKGWHCSVNWFFLHIEQQTDTVYHHQTCQAKLDGTRGPIGKLSEWKNIIDDLKDKLKTKMMPIIVCPNKYCGCGLCTPKSNNLSNLLNVLPNTLSDTSIFLS